MPVGPARAGSAGSVMSAIALNGDAAEVVALGDTAHSPRAARHPSATVARPSVPEAAPPVAIAQAPGRAPPQAPERRRRERAPAAAGRRGTAPRGGGRCRGGGTRLTAEYARSSSCRESVRPLSKGAPSSFQQGSEPAKPAVPAKPAAPAAPAAPTKPAAPAKPATAPKPTPVAPSTPAGPGLRVRKGIATVTWPGRRRYAAGNLSWRFRIVVREDAIYEATIYRPAGRGSGSKRRSPVLGAGGPLDRGASTVVTFPVRRLGTGSYAIEVVVASKKDPNHLQTVLTSPTFVVGAPKR